ncbi:ankyrin repeat domain-containing protein [Paenibacillus sp. FSL L8-0470]|uniref:ankyrin repeat domain-containing protein n=1 Tax=Paenibacillus sp. FSL L8-0470 TaxID=2954688 RepID=UPI0030FB4142
MAIIHRFGHAILNWPEGIDLNQGDYMGRTPLHYAIGENNPKIASLLQKLGANPNQQDVNQKSPLLFDAASIWHEVDQ